MRRLTTTMLAGLLIAACAQNPAPGSAPYVLSPTPPTITTEAPAPGPAPGVIEPIGGQAQTPTETPATPEPSLTPTDRVLWTGKESWESAVFSEDGSVLAFTRRTSGLAGELWLTDTATGETRVVADDVVAIFPGSKPKLNADGSVVLFRRTLGGGGGSWHDMGELWTWDWVTGETQLVSESAHKATYRFTADGSAVLYVHTQAGALIHYDLETQEQVELDTDVHVEAWMPGEQVLHISPNGRWLAYAKGDGNQAELYLMDLDTLEGTLVSGEAAPRSIRLDDQWLGWRVNEGEPSRIHERRHADGEEVWSGLGVGQEFGDNGTVAYLENHASGFGDLVVWSRHTGVELAIDTGVRHGAFEFDPFGTHVVYMRALDTTSFGYRGALWLAEVGSNVRVKVHDDALYPSGWFVAFDPTGRFLVYRHWDCAAGGIYVHDIETQETLAIGKGICDRPYMLPDGSGLVVARDTPSDLMRYDFADGSLTWLAGTPHQHLESPDATRTAHTVGGAGYGDGVLRLTDWATETVFAVPVHGAWPLAISDQHVVYRRTEPHQLRLVTLP